MTVWLTPCSRRQFLCVGSTLAVAGLSSQLHALAQSGAEIDVRSGQVPTVVRGGDTRFYLGYELHVTAPRDDLQLESLRVFDGRDLLLAYGPRELDERTMRPDLARDSRYGRMIRAGSTAVVSMWLELPEGRRRPRALRHELNGSSSVAPIATKSVAVDESEPLVLGPPLRGLWLAHNGPGDHRSAHWGSMMVHGRQITVPQRFAIDFMGLDGNGRAIRGALENSLNSDWPGFGRDVIAVAKGLVREARDGIADNPPLFEPPPPTSVSLPAVGGNYVLLDLGRSRFVHYVHLQKGSVRVRPGQRVRRGQILGCVGNSGNTNGAHLHFNVVNGLRLAEAEGLPYVFSSHEAHGTTSIDAAFSESPTVPGPSRDIQEALPLNGSIVEFPGR